MKLGTIKAAHTAQPFTPAVGTGLSANNQPSVYAPAIVSNQQAQPHIKALKPNRTK